MHKRALEKILKALANRRRLAILAHLKKNGTVSVATISKELNIPFKTVSRNLVMLERVGIVNKKQLHQQRIYRLNETLKLFVKNLVEEL